MNQEQLEQIATAVREADGTSIHAQDTTAFLTPQAVHVGGKTSDGTNIRLTVFKDSGNVQLEVGTKQADGTWKNEKVKIGGKQLKLLALISEACYANQTGNHGNNAGPVKNLF